MDAEAGRTDGAEALLRETVGELAAISAELREIHRLMVLLVIDHNKGDTGT